MCFISPHCHFLHPCYINLKNKLFHLIYSISIHHLSKLETTERTVSNICGQFVVVPSLFSPSQNTFTCVTWISIPYYSIIIFSHLTHMVVYKNWTSCPHAARICRQPMNLPPNVPPINHLVFGRTLLSR